MSLEALKQALAEPLAAHPEVKVGRLDTAVEFVTLTVEPEGGPIRYLRAASVPELADGQIYVMRWAAYRGKSDAEEGEGSYYGDLELTLRTINDWIFEGRPFSEVFDTRRIQESEGTEKLMNTTRPSR